MLTEEGLTRDKTERRPAKGLVLAYGSVAAALMTLAFWAYVGSFEAMARFAAGDRLFLTHSVQDLGRVGPETKVGARFTLKNVSGDDIHIVGTQAGCTCTILGEATPIAIPAHSSRAIDVAVTAPKIPGAFRYPLDLFTDSESRPRIQLSVKGVIIK